jgi:hypothetical protein
VLHYFFSGFYVIYFTVSFMDLAPRTLNPALWAGMGRVFRSFFIGLTAALSEWLFAAADRNTVITVNTLVCSGSRYMAASGLMKMSSEVA